MALDLTVIILTYNEELHIERAIDSIKSLAKEIFIVDSGSDDNTIEIARQQNAKIFFNKFVNQAKQFQWAIDNTPIMTEWVMRLDADEIIENDLAKELIKKIPNLENSITGINLDRKHIFMGKWVRYGGRYPLKMLRIWRHGMAKVEDRWMDEHIILSQGHSISIKGGFSDNNLNNLSYFTEKHNKYATREAVDVILKKINFDNQKDKLNINNSSFWSSFKRSVKENIYNKLPFGIGPLLYFIFRYFAQLGFLDGKSGFVYHFLQGYWYRLLVDAKVYEFEKFIDKFDSQEKKIEELSSLSGYKLN